MHTSHAWKIPSKHVKQLLRSFVLQRQEQQQQQQQQRQRMLLPLLHLAAAVAAEQPAVRLPKAVQAGSQVRCGDQACQQQLQQQFSARTSCLKTMSWRSQLSLQVLLLVLLGLVVLLLVLLLLLV
jgi:hypothetical protein